MDVLSLSKIKPKPDEIIFVDDSDSQSSSLPPPRNTNFQNDQDSDSDDFLFESESFISASDELIDGNTSLSSDSENDNDIDVQIKEKITTEESSLASFTSSLKNNSKVNPKITKSKITNINSSDDGSSNVIYSVSYSSQNDYLSSSMTSSQNILNISPKLNNFSRFKHPNKSKKSKISKNNRVDDLDDFIEQDEYDYEEVENSSDRRFIASDSQISDDISFYRQCDIDKLSKKTKKKMINASSSDSDFESSTSSN